MKNIYSLIIFILFIQVPGNSLPGGIVESINQTVLTFDDITTERTALIPTGYGGFTWNGFGVTDGSDENFYEGTGYDLGRVSGNYVASLLSSSGTFEMLSGEIEFGEILTFESVYLAAAWRNDLYIMFEGLLDEEVLFSDTAIVSVEQGTLFNFNFAGINKLRITSFGGIDAGLCGDGTCIPGRHFAMDNFVIYQIEDPIEGCTDPAAHNYDPAAQVDDSSCQTCFDGILNGDETGIDCGGLKCISCPDDSGGDTLEIWEITPELLLEDDVFVACTIIRTAGDLLINNNLTLEAGSLITIRPPFTSNPGVTIRMFITPNVCPLFFNSLNDPSTLLSNTKNSGLDNLFVSKNDPSINIRVMPNPFSTSAEVFFTLSTSSKVFMEVYNVNGQLIERPIAGASWQAGEHQFTYFPNNSVKGTLLLLIRIGDKFAVWKMNRI